MPRSALPPVFVISAGWRSGSTAIQRLLSSSGKVFVWGEPFAEARLGARLALLSSQALYGHETRRRVAQPQPGSDWSSRWIANSHPPEANVIAGVRGFVESTMWPPLYRAGFAGWGVKEVNLPVDALRLLSAAFPDGRFVLLVRDPADAYASFRRYVVQGIDGRSTGRKVRWIASPWSFAAVWSELAAEFLRWKGDPRFLLVKYEDIVGQDSFVRDLSDFVGSDLDRTAWHTVVGSVTRTGSRLEKAECGIVRRRTGGVARSWGYR